MDFRAAPEFGLKGARDSLTNRALNLAFPC
jgi:hypothetical protein